MWKYPVILGESRSRMTHLGLFGFAFTIDSCDLLPEKAERMWSPLVRAVVVVVPSLERDFDVRIQMQSIAFLSC